MEGQVVDPLHNHFDLVDHESVIAWANWGMSIPFHLGEHVLIGRDTFHLDFLELQVILAANTFQVATVHVVQSNSVVILPFQVEAPFLHLENMLLYCIDTCKLVDEKDVEHRRDVHLTDDISFIFSLSLFCGFIDLSLRVDLSSYLIQTI